MISGNQNVKFSNFLIFCPSFPYICHSHIHSHLILDPESECYDDFGGGQDASEVIIKRRSRIQEQVAVYRLSNDVHDSQRQKRPIILDRLEKHDDKIMLDFSGHA